MIIIPTANGGPSQVCVCINSFPQLHQQKFLSPILQFPRRICSLFCPIETSSRGHPICSPTMTEHTLRSDFLSLSKVCVLYS